MKYYIPNIEEFHVGFEYEEEVCDNNGFEKTVYTETQRCYKWGYDNITFDELVKRNRIRVKYLDREDIQSLGWSINSWSNVDGGLSIYDFNKYCLFEQGNNRWSITIPDLGTTENGKFYHYTIFDGTIKNKSKLKVLMKQLNILK